MFPAALKTLALVASVTASTVVAASWKATLEPVEGSGISGESTVTPDHPMPMQDSTAPKHDGSAMARIAIKGAKANDSLPWHVHSGTCGSANAPIVGSGADYSPIAVGENGEGSAHAKVSTRLEPNGQYIVNVHKSATDLTVVSCGALRSDGVTPDAR
jgi:hypothetical protein